MDLINDINHLYMDQSIASSRAFREPLDVVRCIKSKIAEVRSLLNDPRTRGDRGAFRERLSTLELTASLIGEFFTFISDDDQNKYLLLDMVLFYSILQASTDRASTIRSVRQFYRGESNSI